MDGGARMIDHERAGDLVRLWDAVGLTRTDVEAEAQAEAETFFRELREARDPRPAATPELPPRASGEARGSAPDFPSRGNTQS